MAITKSKNITLRVLLQEGDFEISSLDLLEVKAGENIGFTIDVVPELGFAAPVKFSLAGLPAGVTVEWQNGDTWQPGAPEPNNLQCNLSIPLNVAIGDYLFSLDGVSL